MLAPFIFHCHFVLIISKFEVSGSLPIVNFYYFAIDINICLVHYSSFQAVSMGRFLFSSVLLISLFYNCKFLKALLFLQFLETFYTGSKCALCAQKTIPENGAFSWVPFCLRSHVRFERCGPLFRPPR